MVAGDLVNTASRLQSVAAPGTVLVGEATQRAASSAIVFEPAGEHALKGKDAPGPGVGAQCGSSPSARAWVAATGSRHRSSAATRSCACSRTSSTPRHASSAPDSSRSRARPASARPASPGSSSSTSTGVVEGVWWHDGRSPAYGEGVTFWALGEMVRYRAGLLETDDPTTTRAKVAEMVVTHVPDEEERRWIEPALLALLGVGEAPAGGRDELFRAWRTFFERMASTGIVTLLFEDLQWADPGLLDFIDHLLEWSRGVPILIMTLARPELLDRRPDWGAGRRNFLALGLEPLPERRDARAAGRPRARAAGGDRRARSSPAPTASRCTRSRPSGCLSQMGAWPRSMALRAGRRARRAGRARDAPGVDRGSPGWPGPGRPGAPPGRRRPRPELHTGRAGGGLGRRRGDPPATAPRPRSGATS